MEKFIKKAKLPLENSFIIDDKFIKSQFGLNNEDYKKDSVKFHFTETNILIEYEKKPTASPANSFMKK